MVFTPFYNQQYTQSAKKRLTNKGRDHCRPSLLLLSSDTGGNHRCQVVFFWVKGHTCSPFYLSPPSHTCRYKVGCSVQVSAAPQVQGPLQVHRPPAGARSPAGAQVQGPLQVHRCKWRCSTLYAAFVRVFAGSSAIFHAGRKNIHITTGMSFCIQLYIFSLKVNI